MTIQNRPSLKSQLRTEMRRLLVDHSGNPSPVIDALEQRLLALHAPHHIAIYAALPGEIDLCPLASRIPQHHWLYPRVDGDQLTFHPIRNPKTELTAGAFGILEPIHGLPTTPLDEIDAFICPGLAFDAHGGRLGRGRGFYDRMLSSARHNALKIGVGFASQLVADTFSEDHDITMDEVICAG